MQLEARSFVLTLRLRWPSLVSSPIGGQVFGFDHASGVKDEETESGDGKGDVKTKDLTPATLATLVTPATLEPAD